MSERLKAQDLYGRDLEDLSAELVNMKQELFNLRFQHHTNQLENHMQIGQVKKNIARIKTVLRSKELEKLAGK